MKSPAPTIDDVARLAGVSTATVSRCLNTPERVGQATQKKVESVIKTLGYAPNFSARTMAARRTFTVGAVIPTMENSIFALGLQAFQEELRDNGYTLLVASSSYSPEQEEKQVRTLLARGADALLLIGYARYEETYTLIAKRKVPTVIAWAYDQNSALTSVGFNNREAMFDLAAHVLNLGHKNISIITAPTKSNDRAYERVEAIKDAARLKGINAEEIKTIETPYGIESGDKAAEKLLTLKKRPTAIMCVNDVLAVGAMKAARRLGLTIPDDVSITGFDDIELSRITEPPLTTVHVPHRKMGREAAKILLNLINDQNFTAHSQLKTTLTLRGSLGPIAPKAI